MVNFRCAPIVESNIPRDVLKIPLLDNTVHLCGLLPLKIYGILRASLPSRKTPLKSNEVRRKRATALQKT